jgi:hypothetical protein
MKTERHVHAYGVWPCRSWHGTTLLTLALSRGRRDAREREAGT